jgi:hypothetical protein
MQFETAVKCFDSRIKVKASKFISYHLTLEKEGFITREPIRCSGLWGYGGASVAIYIDNEPFPLNTCELVGAHE